MKMDNDIFENIRIGAYLELSAEETMSNGTLMKIKILFFHSHLHGKWMEMKLRYTVQHENPLCLICEVLIPFMKSY